MPVQNSVRESCWAMRSAVKLENNVGREDKRLSSINWQPLAGSAIFSAVSQRRLPDRASSLGRVNVRLGITNLRDDCHGSAHFFRMP